MNEKPPLCNCKTIKKIKTWDYKEKCWKEEIRYGKLVPVKADSEGFCIDCGYHAVNVVAFDWSNSVVKESWSLKYIPGLFKKDPLLPWYWHLGGVGNEKQL